MNVTYFYRSLKKAFSIQRVFNDVRADMPAEVRQHVFYCQSSTMRNPLLLLKDIIRARRNRGEINHITGDSHFLTYLLPKKRTLLTIHDCGRLHTLSGLRRYLVKLLLFSIPLRRVGEVTFVSEYSQKDLEKALGHKIPNARIIYNPYSKAFQPVPKPFDRNCPRVLAIGTGPNKNLPRLIEALRGIPCHLRIIGRLHPPQLKALEDNGVTYSNAAGISDEQIVREYEDCDIVAFVSAFEGFGMPVIEGQAVGRPVLTSNVTSLPEVVGDGSAVVADPLDVASIREGILSIINDTDLREDLVRRGFENIRRFDGEHIARQYYELYQEMLNR